MINRAFLFALIPVLLLPAAALAADDPAPRIKVTATGSAEVAPDMAVLSLTVTREAATARAALDAGNQAMSGVIAEMRDAGIAERDLRTSGFSISPRYVYPKPDDRQEPPKIVGYEVSNSLTVRIRDISKVGQLLDRSVSLGVNQGGNVTFANDDPSAALAEARRKAVAEALEKAATLAEAAHVGVGRIMEITEKTDMPRPPEPLVRTMAMEASAVPIATGENEYTVTVSVTFAIEQ